jgi:stage V sporulation protein AD
MGKIINFDNAPLIFSSASVVGKKEKEGPLSEYFDIHDFSDKFGQKTFEQAESEMQRLSLNLALSKAKLRPEDVDAIFAGDLMNQCTGSSYGLASFGASYFGLYGACSTAAEGIILASIAVSSGVFDRVASVSSSHNSSAERQFRFPLEYGSQRPPTAQWTATAAASFLIGKEGSCCVPPIARVTEALPGKIVDKGITDANNMGAAMAPAAADTLIEYFLKNKRNPEEFDLIVTGDLGHEGHSICRELMAGEGLNLGERFNDCGRLIYDSEKQDTHSGGSGCGCSASVTAGYIMDGFEKGIFKNVLLVGTGALMSPMSIQQGLSVAGIGHLVRFSSVNG